MGDDFSNWEGKAVSEHFKNKFGVVFTVRRCRYLLHELGFSLKRPRHAFPKADVKKQERFIRNLEKKLGSFGLDDVLLFQDEMSVQFAATITRMWSLRGEQPKVFTHSGRKCQPLIGAVDPIEGRIHVALADKLKAVQFQHFLEGLLARYPSSRKLIVVLDNARIHHSKVLNAFLEANKNRIELMFLPSYSPDLNPMEWFWRFLWKQVTHNIFFWRFQGAPARSHQIYHEI
ncbi:MAG: IS630 family transposase [Promethearchaeota archaeon]